MDHNSMALITYIYNIDGMLYLLWECLLDYWSIVPDKQYCIILVSYVILSMMHTCGVKSLYHAMELQLPTHVHHMCDHVL